MHPNKNISRIKELSDAGSHLGQLLAVDVTKQSIKDEPSICYDTGVDNPRETALADSKVNIDDDVISDLPLEMQFNHYEESICLSIFKVVCILAGVTCCQIFNASACNQFKDKEFVVSNLLNKGLWGCGKVTHGLFVGLLVVHIFVTLGFMQVTDFDVYLYEFTAWFLNVFVLVTFCMALFYGALFCKFRCSPAYNPAYTQNPNPTYNPPYNPTYHPTT